MSKLSYNLTHHLVLSLFLFASCSGQEGINRMEQASPPIQGEKQEKTTEINSELEKNNTRTSVIAPIRLNKHQHYVVLHDCLENDEDAVTVESCTSDEDEFDLITLEGIKFKKGKPIRCYYATNIDESNDFTQYYECEQKDLNGSVLKVPIPLSYRRPTKIILSQEENLSIDLTGSIILDLNKEDLPDLPKTIPEFLFDLLYKTQSNPELGRLTLCPSMRDLLYYFKKHYECIDKLDLEKLYYYKNKKEHTCLNQGDFEIIKLIIELTPTLLYTKFEKKQFEELIDLLLPIFLKVLWENTAYGYSNYKAEPHLYYMRMAFRNGDESFLQVVKSFISKEQDLFLDENCEGMCVYRGVALLRAIGDLISATILNYSLCSFNNAPIPTSNMCMPVFNSIGSRYYKTSCLADYPKAKTLLFSDGENCWFHAAHYRPFHGSLNSGTSSLFANVGVSHANAMQYFLDNFNSCTNSTFATASNVLGLFTSGIVNSTGIALSDSVIEELCSIILKYRFDYDGAINQRDILKLSILLKSHLKPVFELAKELLTLNEKKRSCGELLGFFIPASDIDDCMETQISFGLGINRVSPKEALNLYYTAANYTETCIEALGRIARKRIVSEVLFVPAVNKPGWTSGWHSETYKAINDKLYEMLPGFLKEANKEVFDVVGIRQTSLLSLYRLYERLPYSAYEKLINFEIASCNAKLFYHERGGMLDFIDSVVAASKRQEVTKTPESKFCERYIKKNFPKGPKTLRDADRRYITKYANKFLPKIMVLAIQENISKNKESYEAYFSKTGYTVLGAWGVSSIYFSLLRLLSHGGDCENTIVVTCADAFAEELKGKIQFNTFSIPLPNGLAALFCDLMLSGNESIRICCTHLCRRMQEDTHELEKIFNYSPDIIAGDFSVDYKNHGSYQKNGGRSPYILLESHGYRPMVDNSPYYKDLFEDKDIPLAQHVYFKDAFIDRCSIQGEGRTVVRHDLLDDSVIDFRHITVAEFTGTLKL